MELDNVDHDTQHLVSGVTTSPFFMGSRESTASPQPWELHDVDFLLPEPVEASTRSYFRDSSRKYCSSLHEPEIAFSPELDDASKPLAFRSGTYWQDVTMNEPATNEFSVYLADDVFSDKVAVVQKSPSSKTARGKLVSPTTTCSSTKLRVNATACTDEDIAENSRKINTPLKNAASVVSPTMVDKKILVTDNDLKLFSAGNLRALNVRKAAVKSSARSEHHSRKIKMMSACSTTPAAPLLLPPTAHRQHIKRRASMETHVDDQTARTLKRTKSLDQSAWCAPAFDPRWFWGRTEGFHGMQPRLLSPINSSTSLGYSGANIYRPIYHQVGVQQPQQLQNQQFQPQYSAPKRKIGIYSPAERRERLKRFHEKRKLRVYHKRIKYDCRKRLANSCPRIKGRFVRKTDFAQASDAASPTEDN